MSTLRRWPQYAAAVMIAAAALPARANWDDAPDVVVFCDPTLKPALQDAGALFRAQTGVPVRVLSTTGIVMAEQIARNERDDVLVTFAPAMEYAVSRGQAKADTRTDAWRDALVLARRGDPGNPAPASADAVAAALAGGKLAIPDPTPASVIDGPALLDRIAPATPATGAANTPDVAFLVATGVAPLGLMFVTDVRADARLSVAFTLPAADALPVAAALSRNTASKSGPAFLAFLRSDAASAALRARGLEQTP